MESSTRSGDGTVTRFSRQIPRLTISALSILNLVAINGDYVETAMPCDIPSTQMIAYNSESGVEIESVVDCGTRRLNQSSAAGVLISMAREICGF